MPHELKAAQLSQKMNDAQTKKSNWTLRVASPPTGQIELSEKNQVLTLLNIVSPQLLLQNLKTKWSASAVTERDGGHSECVGLEIKMDVCVCVCVKCVPLSWV